MRRVEADAAKFASFLYILHDMGNQITVLSGCVQMTKEDLKILSDLSKSGRLTEFLGWVRDNSSGSERDCVEDLVTKLDSDTLVGNIESLGFASEALMNIYDMCREVLEGKSDSFNPNSYDLNFLTRSVVKGARSTLKENQIKELYYPGLKPVRVDRENYLRCLLNILLNAHQANARQFEGESKGRVIHVETGLDKRGSWVSIRDSGVGLKPDEIEGLYLSDERVSSKGSGHGYGRLFVRECMKKHNGFLDVSSPGGLEIKLTFPNA
jgi:signal transduction histidine kinase